MRMQNDFINFHLKRLKYNSIQDMIENLYLKSLVACYSRIDKTKEIENSIRDRFVKDLYRYDSPIKKWIDIKIIRVNWEQWVLTDDDDLGRIDLTFQSAGLDFIVECKRLKFVDKKYFTEGLARFIELKYAKGEDHAAMLGFVVSGNEKRICNGLEAMSTSYSGVSNEFTSKSFTLWQPNFKSAHLRNDQTVIGVYHLFFDFSLPVLENIIAE